MILALVLLLVVHFNYIFIVGMIISKINDYCATPFRLNAKHLPNFVEFIIEMYVKFQLMFVKTWNLHIDIKKIIFTNQHCIFIFYYIDRIKFWVNVWIRPNDNIQWLIRSINCRKIFHIFIRNAAKLEYKCFDWQHALYATCFSCSLSNVLSENCWKSQARHYSLHSQIEYVFPLICHVANMKWIWCFVNIPFRHLYALSASTSKIFDWKKNNNSQCFPLGHFRHSKHFQFKSLLHTFYVFG